MGVNQGPSDPDDPAGADGKSDGRNPLSAMPPASHTAGLAPAPPGIPGTPPIGHSGTTPGRGASPAPPPPSTASRPVPSGPSPGAGTPPPPPRCRSGTPPPGIRRTAFG